MFQSEIYLQSPRWLQEVFISARSGIRNLIRETSAFRRILKGIEISQWANESDFREYQFKKLVNIIRHVENNVPYYRELFRQEGLSSTDLVNLEDIKKFPILTKEHIRLSGKKLMDENAKGLKFRASTSGTTGSPITLYHNQDTIRRENAFVWRQLHWAGFKKGEKRAWIRGEMIVPFEQENPPFWRMNWADNMFMMSAYHLSETNAQHYITALQKFDPVIIQTHPSAITYLAKYLEKLNKEYRGDNLRAIVTSSETLTDEQRTIVTRRMGCPVFDWYGSVERVVSIGMCEKGNYHLNSDYGFVELLRNRDGSASLVGTGFINYLMPLVRYQTKDLVEMVDEKFECACGRKLPVVKRIIGRMDDYVKTKDGRFIGRLSQVTKGVNNVAEAQIVQDSTEEIRILVVPFGKFREDDRARLLRNAHQRMGSEMRIHVELVDAIPRTKRGKFRYVVCNV